MENNVNEKQEIRRRMKLSQWFLNLFLFGAVAYLAWYRLDSSRVSQKNQELWELAWQTTEENLKKSPKGEEEIQGTREEGDRKTTDNVSGTVSEKEGVSEEQYIPGFDALVSVNSEVKGWLSIPGTTLSLPVVQGTDTSYYLNHDFYGENDRHGTIFIDCEADFENGWKNTVLYGHNMRDGSMFGSLRAYRNEEYYREHPYFVLYLPDAIMEYEILAVLRNDILPGEEELFQYYDYKQIENEEMFEEYYEEIKEHSLYDIAVEAQYGDELVTLCTCDYGSEDQRLLVVGKKKQH